MVSGPPPPSIAVTKSVWPPNAAPGTDVTYTIDYANTSPALTGVTITDTIPLDVAYVAKSASSRYFTGFDGYNLTWTPGSLAPGATGWMTFLARVKQSAPVGTEVANTANPSAQ